MKPGITFSSLVAMTLVNTLYSDERRAMGLYELHNCGSLSGFSRIVIRACSKVLGSWCISSECLNISISGVIRLDANAFRSP